MAMNFVSFEFAAFLAVVYALHWNCPYASIRKWLLTIASYVFYAVWNWRFCFLMLFVLPRWPTCDPPQGCRVGLPHLR